MTAKITRLDNGLRIASDRMDHVETVSIGVWADIGTRHETSDINGLSHLLEHMAFKGTKKRTALQIAEEIENVGGYLNAYTSREMTAYYTKVLADDAPLALDILSDILQNSTFEEQELAREKGVVVQEILQSLDTPDDLVFDLFQKTAFPDQPIGYPVLGTENIVKDISRDMVDSYMRLGYTAPRLVVAASGRVDHDWLVENVSKAFSNISNKDNIDVQPAIYKGGDFRQKKDIEQLQFALGFEGISYEDPDYYAASVLSTVLGGGMSSRLFQEVREKRGLTYSIYSFSSSYNDSGMFGIYAGTGEKQAKDLVPVICNEICKISSSNVLEEELLRAKNQLKASILMARESSSARCEQTARQLMVFNRLLPISEIVEKLEAVDADMVRKAASRIFSSIPTVTALGPHKELIGYEKVGELLP